MQLGSVRGLILTLLGRKWTSTLRSILDVRKTFQNAPLRKKESTNTVLLLRLNKARLHTPTYFAEAEINQTYRWSRFVTFWHVLSHFVTF